MEPGDAELVARARDGESAAFAALAERHRGSLLRLVRRWVSRPEDAQDVAQEALVQAFVRLDTLRDPERFGPWLSSIAVNAARQLWRREAQISFEPLWQEGEALGAEHPATVDTAVPRLREIVRDALAALPPEPRAAVLLHYFDGYDYREAAALLDVPVSTVRGRLHVARRRLREEMAELAPRTQKVTPTPAPLWEGRLTRDDLIALRAAEMHAARDEVRPALQAVCIEPDGAIVATDTHRLFRYRVSTVRPPRRALVRSTLFAPLWNCPDLEELYLSLGPDNATLRRLDPSGAPAEELSQAPLVTNETFPDYDRVFPTDWRLAVTLTVRDLLTALEELARFQNFLVSSAAPDGDLESTKVMLAMCGGADMIVLGAGGGKEIPAPTRWTFQTELPAALQGLSPEEEFVIAFNRHYLRECPRALHLATDDRVTLRLNGPLLPVAVEPATEDRTSILVMPMQRFPTDPVVAPRRRS